MNLLEGHSTDEVKLKSQFGSKSAELVSSFIHLVNIHLVARDLLEDKLIRGQNLKKTNTWRDSNPQTFGHEVRVMQLCFNHCPFEFSTS